MSAESLPITASAFTEALKSLPLSSIYAKVFELRNSINHLERSNLELKQYLHGELQGDKDLEEAIVENEGVIKRFDERIGLLKLEVEGRGQKWIDDLEKTNGNETGDTVQTAEDTEAPDNENSSSTQNQPQAESGSTGNSYRHVRTQDTPNTQPATSQQTQSTEPNNFGSNEQDEGAQHGVYL